MNIRGGNKHRIDRKKLALKREMNRDPEHRDYKIIKRLKESIARNKHIDLHYKRRKNKIKNKNKI